MTHCEIDDAGVQSATQAIKGVFAESAVPA
jgi:hypothetical protein